MNQIRILSNSIEFTTDTLEYKMHNKLEEVMEILYKKFNLTEFNIKFHIHKGEVHDKDIIVLLKDNNQIDKKTEISKFIKENFYLNKDK